MDLFFSILQGFGGISFGSVMLYFYFRSEKIVNRVVAIETRMESFQKSADKLDELKGDCGSGEIKSLAQTVIETRKKLEAQEKAIDSIAALAEATKENGKSIKEQAKAINQTNVGLAEISGSLNVMMEMMKKE